MSSHAPPGMGTVYRAVLDTMAEHGPRRPPIAQIARLAFTNRQFLYRNWPKLENLFQEACAAELGRILSLAGDTTAGAADGPTPPSCHVIAQIVRAARLLREHPVTEATARTSPDLCLAALTGSGTPLHLRAQHWLQRRLYTLCSGTDLKITDLEITDVEIMADALFTVAAPFALIPPASPSPTERARLDALLRSALHSCLRSTPACTDCGAKNPPTPHQEGPTG